MASIFSQGIVGDSVQEKKRSQSEKDAAKNPEV
jgi:hypothetical protein